jgi:voltage-dependent calcium channel L type alpha-1D
MPAIPTVQLLNTLFLSLSSLANVAVILLLLYFVYAVVGMNLFAGVKYGQYINRDANFSTFLLSMLTLFRWVGWW